MSDDQPLFGLHFSNIPIANLRMEFAHHLGLLRREDFRRLFLPESDELPQTNYLVWYGMPDELLSFLAQRAILGIESFVRYAAVQAGAVSGRDIGEVFAIIRDPWKRFKGGTAEILYNKILGHVDSSLSMKVSNPDLWEVTLPFYRQIRNPLFHGSYFNDPGAEGTLQVFEYIARVYAWIDSWIPPLQRQPRKIDGPTVTFRLKATRGPTVD